MTESTRDIYGPHYAAKGRDFPRSRVDPATAQLFRELDAMASEQARNVTLDPELSQHISKKVQEINDCQTNNWTTEVVEYYLRKTYFS